MESLLGMIIGIGMRERRLTGMRTGICASMECWNVGILEAVLDLETCTYLLLLLL